MTTVSRDFKICDRCQTEVQVYELNDEGLMTDHEWLAVATNPDRKGYHLCPECASLFRDFMIGMVNIPAISIKKEN